jgi:cyclopropane fatty-acyl-phospholipid synthase-like methyltransferase
MKPANESRSDCKRIVQQGYNQCAKRYLGARQEAVLPEIEILESRLKIPSRVLDLGCGSGVPITKWLAAKYKVTGVDFSEEQINLARVNVPSADFICTDIMDLSFRPSSFEAIVSLYVIFHLPRQEQAVLFKRMSKWLAPGGYLFASLSYVNQPSYTEDDFFGVKMYWDSMSLDKYEKLMKNEGFNVIQIKEIGHGYSSSARSESHPIVLLKRRRAHNKSLKPTP